MTRWGLVQALVAPFIALALLSGCAVPRGTCGAEAAQETDVAGYHLGPGDLVRVNVFQQAELSGQFRLDGEGDLALPLAGEIHAGRLTTRELEQAIAARLREGGYLRNPQVGVQVLTYRPFYIVGEVRRPGEYEYRAGMTLINAAALAGGYTYRARDSAVTIERGGCVMGTGPDTPVLPGDVIRVPERFF